MQLKRDTEYALRLLFGAAKYAGESGITLSELCKHTAVPRTIASRLCAKLVEAKLLNEKMIETKPVYFACKDIYEKTLFDIVLATEETLNLFAVFDQSSEMYISCKSDFDLAQQKFANCLQQIKIRNQVSL